jgi:uncharacterized protein (DUF111 family)
MKILYYDCFAGISGDMNLGAMLDLGIEADYLKNELSKLPVNGYTLQVTRDIRKGISGTRVNVMIDEQRLLIADHGTIMNMGIRMIMNTSMITSIRIRTCKRITRKKNQIIIHLQKSNS